MFPTAFVSLFITNADKVSQIKVSQPHFGLSVRVKPTLPKVRTWSPLGLPKIQSSS